MHAKSIFRSKTMWVNLGLAVLGVFQAQGVFDLVSPDVLATSGAIANLVLRLVTKQPVTVPGVS